MLAVKKRIFSLKWKIDLKWNLDLPSCKLVVLYKSSEPKSKQVELVGKRFLILRTCYTSYVLVLLSVTGLWIIFILANDSGIQETEKKRNVWGSWYRTWFKSDLFFPNFFIALTLNFKQSLIIWFVSFIACLFVYMWLSHWLLEGTLLFSRLWGDNAKVTSLLIYFDFGFDF